MIPENWSQHAITHTRQKMITVPPYPDWQRTEQVQAYSTYNITIDGLWCHVGGIYILFQNITTGEILWCRDVYWSWSSLCHTTEADRIPELIMEALL